MTEAFDKLRSKSPAQAEALASAVATGRFDALSKQQMRACRSLNSAGLLSRDRQNAALWYPTPKAVELVGPSDAAPKASGGMPAAPPEAAAQANELVAIVSRARALLDEGDVQAALKLSSVAYDQARAAASSAARVKASRALVDKARALQADALKIESLAYVAMADAVDEAQAKGEISRGGRPAETVQGADRFTLEDIGIDKRRLSEARQVRNAVKAEPAFIDRVIAARLSEGLEPSRAALKKAAGHALGTRSATKEERGADLYETPIEAVRMLLALESFSKAVMEPSVGKGAILRPLEEAGYDVTIADLLDRGIATRHGECQAVADFLRSSQTGAPADIVTNPPFGIANAYAAHALREHRPGKLALLLNLNFMCGFEDPDRRFVMDESPPSRIYVFTRRLPMMHRDGYAGPEAASQMNCAWFVWERNAEGGYGAGFPELIRVDWKRFRDAAPLAPGIDSHAAPRDITRAVAEEDFTRETPRRSVGERVDEERERARAWIAGEEHFDAAGLRRGIGVRPSVAEALIADLLARGLIVPLDDGSYVIAVPPDDPRLAGMIGRCDAERMAEAV